MTAGELARILSTFPSEARVVIDVNMDQITSDRNVLDISEARSENLGDEASGDDYWIFIQATGDGVILDAG